MRRSRILLVFLLATGSGLFSATEPVAPELVDQSPYIYAGRLFSARSETSSKQSGSGVAVGPGVVLTAAHVYWREAWEDSDGDGELDRLAEGESPWLAYRKWHPAASSILSDGFENVASIVSLAGYDDVLHEYDDNRNDATSPFEAFNRDCLLLIFSDDTATPHGFQRVFPKAAESGFLGERNFYEVVGYPSAKYSGSDSRKWQVHATTETEALVANRVPSSVYDGGYSFENRLYTGGETLDSHAGNSGGPVIARAFADEPWLVSGIYVGSNALFRGMDTELSAMIDAANSGQISESDSRFRFTQAEFSFAENAGSVQIGVERLGDAADPAVAHVEFVDLSADQQTDYVYELALDWAAGESGIKPFTIQILEDELREGRESFLLMLEGHTNGVLDQPHTALINIEDNDLNTPLDQWTLIDEVGAVDYSEVVFAEGKFVSVGRNNAISWTPDYEDVVVTDFPGLNRLYQLTYANGLFLGSGDGPQMILSDDGIDWEVIELPTAVSLFSTRYGLGWYVAVGGINAGSFSQGEIWVSRDARNWTKIYDERHEIFDDVEFGRGRFLARSGSDIYISTDALSWEKAETVGLGGVPSDIEFGEGVFVNAGRLGGIYISEDGIQWELVRQADDEPWYGVGYRNGYFVTTGGAGKLSTSNDGGRTWIDRLPDIQEHLWHGVTAAGKMVVIGDNGLLMTADLPDFFDFIHEPISQKVNEGETVSFYGDFLSSNAGPFTLQWQRDGIDLGGETGRNLNLEEVGFDDEGSYQLVVSGGGNEYVSPPAILEIAPLILPPGNVTVETSTSRGVKISWVDTSIGETQYRIDRRQSGGETWETVANLEPDSTHFSDRNLQPETSYEYRVVTLSEEGEFAQETDPVQTAPATNIINLSARSLVGKDDQVLIGGFTIPEGADMTLYVRGLGPSLSSSDVLNTISNPRLQLLQSTGSNPIEIVNDDWMEAENAADLLSTELPPPDSRESAILATLPPGAYTVLLSNLGEEDLAVGMIEIYDVSESCADCRLVNLSTRGPVAAGEDLMIGGLVIAGLAEKEILVRALGPSLPLGTSRLADPFMKLVSNSGAEASVDNWEESANAEEITRLDLPPMETSEAAEIFQLSSGIHTLQLSGAGETSGVALLEIFELE